MSIKAWFTELTSSFKKDAIKVHMYDGEKHFYKKNYTKAKKHFEKACDLGSGEAFAALAYMYDAGEGIKRDYKKAKELYEKAAEKNIPVAFNNLGVFYEQGHGVNQNYHIAARYYEKACKLEYSLAFTNLGTFYEHGLGVEVNQVRASQLYKRGCELGDKDGCKALAVLKKHLERNEDSSPY